MIVTGFIEAFTPLPVIPGGQALCSDYCEALQHVL